MLFLSAREFKAEGTSVEHFTDEVLGSPIYGQVNDDDKVTVFKKAGTIGDLDDASDAGMLFGAIKADHVILYCHGYNNSALEAIHDSKMIETHLTGLGSNVQVIAILWASADKKTKYYSDQDVADKSAISIAQTPCVFLDYLAAQQEARGRGSGPEVCTKKIHILAHSMGNRVIRQACINLADKMRPGPPGFITNTWMVAADVVNESLDRGQPGATIVNMSSRVIVYYADDDAALRMSKVVNVRNGIVSYRLGHTGPRDLDNTERWVFAVDCDRFNNTVDGKVGHSYHVGGDEPSPLLAHIAAVIKKNKFVNPGKSVQEYHPRRFELQTDSKLWS